MGILSYRLWEWLNPMFISVQRTEQHHIAAGYILKHKSQIGWTHCTCKLPSSPRRLITTKCQIQHKSPSENPCNDAAAVAQRLTMRRAAALQRDTYIWDEHQSSHPLSAWYASNRNGQMALEFMLCHDLSSCPSENSTFGQFLKQESGSTSLMWNHSCCVYQNPKFCTVPLDRVHYNVNQILLQ